MVFTSVDLLIVKVKMCTDLNTIFCTFRGRFVVINHLLSNTITMCELVHETNVEKEFDIFIWDVE